VVVFTQNRWKLARHTVSSGLTVVSLDENWSSERNGEKSAIDKKLNLTLEKKHGDTVRGVVGMEF